MKLYKVFEDLGDGILGSAFAPYEPFGGDRSLQFTIGPVYEDKGFYAARTYSDAKHWVGVLQDDVRPNQDFRAVICEIEEPTDHMSEDEYEDYVARLDEQEDAEGDIQVKTMRIIKILTYVECAATGECDYIAGDMYEVI